jgi:hypothetical protein
MPQPGLTDTFGDPCSDLKPWGGPLSSLKGVGDRKLVLLSTATITVGNLYANGLFQNVFVFYRMFEAMGYAPIMLVNEKPKDLKNIPEGLRKCRMMVTEDMLKQPMANVAAMLEIGMSLDPLVRQFVKMIGGRLFKVYLGNILNIDVETPIFISHHHFAHHVVGKNDAILVSPHYGQHTEYASYLNHVVPPADLSKTIAPYVWDPNILTRDGTQSLTWRAPATPEEEVFVIMEPNISFQKASFVPLLIMERWYRDIGKPKGWKGKIHLVNGERLLMVPHFLHNIMPYLEIYKDARVESTGRKDIVSTLREWPTATFVLHNYNNEFNYMTLELLWCGFPVLHNSPSWVEFGYGYSGADLKAGAALAEEARTKHSERLETYRAHATTLAWRYSPYNPAIQAAWAAILEK